MPLWKILAQKQPLSKYI